MLYDTIKEKIWAEYHDHTLPELVAERDSMLHCGQDNRVMVLDELISSFAHSKKALAAVTDAYNSFVSQVWHAVTGGELGDWDYPDQVIRLLESELTRLRSNQMLPQGTNVVFANGRYTFTPCQHATILENPTTGTGYCATCGYIVPKDNR